MKQLKILLLSSMLMILTTCINAEIQVKFLDKDKGVMFKNSSFYNTDSKDISPYRNYQYTADSDGNRLTKRVSIMPPENHHTDLFGFYYTPVDIYISSYSYDFINNKVTETQIYDEGDKLEIVYSFDENGVIHSYTLKIKGNIATATYLYDANGKISSITAISTDESHSRIFDINGNIIQAADNEYDNLYNLYNNYTYAYDKNNNVLRITIINYYDDYMLIDSTQTFTYDAKNNITYTHQTTYTNVYNANDKLVGREWKIENITYTQTFDENGNIVTYTAEDTNQIFEKSYTYNSYGFLNKTTFSDITNAVTGEIIYTYNVNKQLTKKSYSDTAGNIYKDNFAYDANGNQILEIHTITPFQGTSYYSRYEYASNGLTLRKESKNGNNNDELLTTTGTYNTKGHILQEVRSNSTDTLSTLDYANTYDANGRLVKVVWTLDNYNIDFSHYNGVSGEKNIMYFEDGARKMFEKTTNQSDGSSYYYKFTYDSNRMAVLTKETMFTTNDDYWSRTAYIYDEKGKPTKTTETNSDGSSETKDYTNTYDVKGQLSKVVWTSNKGDSGEENFTYFENGGISTGKVTTNYADGSYSNLKATHDSNSLKVLTYEEEKIYIDHSGYKVKATFYPNERPSTVEYTTISSNGSWTKTTTMYDEDGSTISEKTETGTALGHMPVIYYILL